MLTSYRLIKYLVFVDADLMILDYNFSIIDDVINLHPAADIILAEDVIGLLLSSTIVTFIPINVWTM